MLVEDYVSSLDLTYIFFLSLLFPLLFLGGGYTKLFENWIQHLDIFFFFKTFVLRALRFKLIVRYEKIEIFFPSCSWEVVYTGIAV